ncbi:Reverse transcriptase domain protein, partial [Thalictrum thalictroides]
MKQYDAVNAFANAKLPNPIYCQCPEGYERKGYVLKAVQAIYGLQKSPLLWYNEITLGFKKLGLFPVPET